MPIGQRFKICLIGVVHFEYFKADDAFGIFQLVPCASFINSYIGCTCGGISACSEVVLKDIMSWSSEKQSVDSRRATKTTTNLLLVNQLIAVKDISSEEN